MPGGDTACRLVANRVSPGKGVLVMMWGYGMGWLATGLVAVVVVAAVVAVAVFLMRAFGDRPLGGAHGATAEELLAQRFARGEIDEQEYRKRREVLSEH
jgi:putative membrane protein